MNFIFTLRGAYEQHIDSITSKLELNFNNKKFTGWSESRYFNSSKLNTSIVQYFVLVNVNQRDTKYSAKLQQAQRQKQVK